MNPFVKLKLQLRRDQHQGRKDKILTELRHHEALTGNKAPLQKYCRSQHINDDQDELLTHLAHQSLNIGSPFEYPRLSDLHTLEEGDFHIGYIGRHGESLYQDSYKLNQGEGIVGGTRKGKTVYLLRKALHLQQLPYVGVFIADIKYDYLKLVHRNFKVIFLKDLLFNPLEHIPETDLEAHCWEIGQQLGSAYYLQNSTTVFSRILLQMFKQTGQPTLEEFRREIHKIKSGATTGLRLDQANVLRGRIDQMCTVLGDKVCNIRYGFQPHRHDQDAIVFGLNLGDPATHGLCVTWLDWWLKTYNQVHNIRPNRLRTALLADESLYLLFPRPDFPPFIDQLCAMHGEFGIGLIAATQLHFSTSFQANTAWKILLSVGDARLFNTQAESMGLTHTQALWAERNLGGAGNAIVSVPEYGEPLLAALAPLEDEIPPATKEDIAKSTDLLNKEITSYTKDQHQKHIPELIENQKRPSSSPGLIYGSLPLLKYSAEILFFHISTAYKDLKLTPEQGNRVKNHLEENGLIRSQTCRIYLGRGRQPVFMEPTQKGIEYLKQHYPNITPKLLAGKGSLEHRVHAHLISQHYQKQGYIVKKEHYEADLGIESSEKNTWFAVEVVNQNSNNIEKRIQENHAAGAEKTIIIASDKKTAIKINQYQGKEKTGIRKIEEFFIQRGTTLS